MVQDGAPFFASTGSFRRAKELSYRMTEEEQADAVPFADMTRTKLGGVLNEMAKQDGGRAINPMNEDGVWCAQPLLPSSLADCWCLVMWPYIATVRSDTVVLTQRGVRGGALERGRPPDPGSHVHSLRLELRRRQQAVPGPLRALQLALSHGPGRLGAVKRP